LGRGHEVPSGWRRCIIFDHGETEQSRSCRALRYRHFDARDTFRTLDVKRVFVVDHRPCLTAPAAIGQPTGIAALDIPVPVTASTGGPSAG
jgi:hypothetical protein